MFTGSAILKAAIELVKAIGAVGITIIVMLGYYEGVPGLRDIPFINKVPGIREFIFGRVQSERAKAAEAAVESLVKRSELTAAQAEADKYRRQAIENSIFAAEARQEALSASKRLNDKLAEQEKASEEDTDPEASRWHQHDLDRLHGNQAAGPPR